jgi:hypothetical protein
MPKYIGNLIGIAQTSTVNSASGIWNLFTQFYFKKQDVWPKDFISSVTGGTVSTPGDGYRYHVFDSPGSLVVSGAGAATLDIANMFLVGGGWSGSNRGGGWEGGGGGGAGEVLNCNGPFKIKIETHTVTIAPGAPAQNSAAGALPGGSTSFADSSLGTLTTGYSGTGGMGVGEGGYAAASDPTYPTVAPLYGTVTPYKNPGAPGGGGGLPGGRGGGGGGAGGAGSNGGSGPGNGGPGTTIPWYPGTYGGGGGGGDAPLSGYPGAGSGGPGGGAPGRGGAGTANTGGGGGGSGSNPSPTPGGPGGSGKLVLRYTASQILA